MVILLAAALLASCGQDSYRPVVYPDASNLKVYEKGPKLSSLEEARTWVRQRTASWGERNWDYEIGKNCRPMFPELPDSLDVCDETLR